MGLDLATLLNLRLYQAFDVDADGRVLAGSDDTGSMQLIEISPDGRATPLTALPGPCSGRYIPGQRAVLVSQDDGGNERTQISALRLPVARPAELPDLEPLVRDARYIHTIAAVRDTRLCYFTNRRNEVDFDPVIRNLADGSERALQLGNHLFGEAALSPDGRWLAVTVASPVTANSEHVALADLSVPAGQEHLVDVTPADALAMTHSLCFTPDSSALYFSSNNDREFTAVARYDIAAGHTDWLVAEDGFDLAGWLSPDGTQLLVERNNDGASELALHDALTGRWLAAVPMPVTGSLGTAPVWSPDSAAVALSFSGPLMPFDVLLQRLGDSADATAAPARVPARDAAGDAAGDVTGASAIAKSPSTTFAEAPAAPAEPARLLTNSAAGLHGDRPAEPELHQIPGDGGLISCQIYRPASDGKLSGSAVLVVHGGPEAQARQNFSTYVQVLAAAGHTVLAPNVRGSTGYGKAWYSADDKRLRLNSVDDLAALHAYLPKLGLDPARAALWGGSYGGYMVLAGLAFQPQLWAAGVDIVGIASLVTFLENTSGYRRAYREREYGTLADDREFLQSVSPLSRADDIIAPLFIIHGANDPRVPLGEAQQIHAAMTRRGRECELLVYSDEGHGLARRPNRLDAIPKALAFLARHLAVQ